MGPENLDFLKMYPVFRIHFWAQNASCKPYFYQERKRIVMAENQAQNPPAEKVIALSASLLEPFQGHPFRVASGEEMEQLKESIREYGVLSPLLVRPRGDGRYEIVSGHRRKAACEALGITELPVLVRNMTDDEAVILMVDSNIQREHILPSEKAFAYKMKMEAIHAGLECGLFKKPYPEMDMVSIGPTITGPHSPDEQVHIESVGHYWTLLTELLKEIPAK